MARRASPENIYSVTILDNTGKRQVKKVKATSYHLSDTPDSVLVSFELRGTLTFMVPFHLFVQAEIVEDSAAVVRMP